MIKDFSTSFKGNEVHFDLTKPITLLFGPNSSGKSSAIHSLLYLHHVINTGESDVRKPLLGHGLVDFGVFNSYIESNGFTALLDTDYFPARLQKYFSKNSLIYYFIECLDDKTKYFTHCELSELIKEYNTEENRGIGFTDSYETPCGASKYSGEYELGNMYLWMDEHRVDYEQSSYPNMINLIFQKRLIESIKQKYPEYSPLFDLDRFSYFNLARLLSGEDVIQENQIEGLHQNKLTDKQKNWLEDFLDNFDYEDLASNFPEVPPEQLDYYVNDLITPEFLKDNKYFKSLEVDFQYLFPRIINPPSLDLDKIIEYLLDDDEVITRSLDEYLQHLTASCVSVCVNSIFDLIKEEINKFRYLGPIRTYPDRFFGFDPGYDKDWSSYGTEAWYRLLNEKTLRDSINTWMANSKKLQKPYQVAVNSYVSNNEIKAFLLQAEKFIETVNEDLAKGNQVNPSCQIEDLKNNYSKLSHENTLNILSITDGKRNMSFRDVGFGLSQLLPVLVESFGNDNKIIMIEQPELHIHPGLQAELADVFINTSLGNNQNRYIIETHSEHLILRLLRRIRETTDDELPDDVEAVAPDDVCILYFDPKHGLQEMSVDENGEFIDQWPGGFFTERAEELF